MFGISRFFTIDKHRSDLNNLRQFKQFIYKLLQCVSVSYVNVILFLQTDTIEATLKKKVQPQLTALGDEFDAPVGNKTVLGWLLVALNGMKQNTSIAVNRSFEIRKPLSGISLAGAIGMGEKIEQLRWPITMAVLSALLVLCVVLLVGVARHSRCVLITYVPLIEIDNRDLSAVFLTFVSLLAFISHARMKSSKIVTKFEQRNKSCS